MNECKTCKKKTKNKVYCSTECQHEGYREKKSKRIKANCVFCGSEFEDTEYRINTIGKKYCYRKCKDTHQKELYEGVGNPSYGQEHSNEWKQWQSERVAELWKSEEHRQKVKEGQERFKEESGHWCGTDEDSKNKRKETFLENYGVDHGWKDEEIRKKCEETNLKLYGKTSFDLMIEAFKKTGGTSIENKIGEILKINDIEFEKSFYVYFDEKKHKIYDFYLSKFNLLIEADGIYWHGHPEFFEILNETQIANVENDKFKNKLAKEKSYNLIRFWGNEIREKDFETKLLKEINRWEKRLE
jgi:very-short-patch-repair endonuclease